MPHSGLRARVILKRVPLLSRGLRFRPGSACYIVGGVLLAAAMVLFTQYKMKGRIDISALVDRDAAMKPFWHDNPRFQYVDSFPRTSFLVVKDKQTGMTSMLDTTVVINAEVRPVPCSAAAPGSSILPPNTTDLACFLVVKPYTGAGVPYVRGVSFRSPVKDVEVARFYRSLFQARGSKITTILNSSSGIILEAENDRGDTLARVSTRSPFDAASTFVAWTQDFDAEAR